MRIRAVLVASLLAIAACSADGVTIEVRGGMTSAERVELYVVDGYCTTDEAGELPCPQLKTPSASGYLEGEVYTRQDARTLESNVESDGVAYFKIVANGDQTRIPLAVAVGFDANDQRVGAVLMPFEFYTTDNNRHIVTLEPIVEDRVTGRPTSDGLRAETWYQEPTLGGGCLALEQTSEGESKRTFIVPADDLDCDGWLEDRECDAIWPHHGANDDSSLPYTCVAEESASGSAKMCLLGAAPCIDGDGPPECKAVSPMGSKFCVSSAVCDPICGDSANPQCLYAALKHPTQPPLKHPTYVHCKVPVQTVTTGSVHSICRQSLTAPIVHSWPFPASTTCNDLSIGKVTATSLGPFERFRDSPSGPMNQVSARVEGQGPCALELEFLGSFPTLPLDNAVPDHVLKLDLSSGLSLILPLVVELVPLAEAECIDRDATCVLDVADPSSPIDESLDACARF